MKREKAAGVADSNSIEDGDAEDDNAKKRHRPWDPQEDELVQALVKKHGGSDYDLAVSQPPLNTTQHCSAHRTHTRYTSAPVERPPAASPAHLTPAVLTVWCVRLLVLAVSAGSMLRGA